MLAKRPTLGVNLHSSFDLAPELKTPDLPRVDSPLFLSEK